MRKLILMSVVGGVLGLSACSTPCAKIAKQAQQGNSVSSLADSKTVKTCLIAALQKQGVDVLEIGDYVRIVIPMNQLVGSSNTVLLNSALPLLNEVNALIQSAPKMTIRVGGYMNPVGSEAADAELTQREAWLVAHYLIRAGVDARFIYAKGYGHNEPVTKVADYLSDNDRIEIELREFNSENSLNLIRY